MKKMINNTGIWILALLTVLIFRCGKDPEPRVPVSGTPVSQTGLDFSSVSGQWTAIKAVWEDESDVRDVTEYFDCFQLTLEQGMAICCINGNETWRSVKEWDNRCTIFENIKDRNTMDFNIKQPGSGESGAELTIVIQKMEPGFSFLPESMNTGIYHITLAR